MNTEDINKIKEIKNYFLEKQDKTLYNSKEYLQYNEVINKLNEVINILNK